MNPARILYLLDLLGCAVFAVSGVLAGARHGLDLFGLLVVGAVTAIGGGTLRDVLLGRHPIQWTQDPACLPTILLAALATVGWLHVGTVPAHALLIADALGLGLFAVGGAQVAEASGRPAPVVVVLGTITGCGGGVVRDLLCGEAPHLLRSDIYAGAAICGIACYLLLQRARTPRMPAAIAGMLVATTVRLLAVANGWQLPGAGPA